MATPDEEGAGTKSAGDEGERPADREAPGRAEEGEREQVPAPTPEEAPELLGERSDYPIVWDPE